MRTQLKICLLNQKTSPYFCELSFCVPHPHTSDLDSFHRLKLLLFIVSFTRVQDVIILYIILYYHLMFRIGLLKAGTF